MGYEPSKCWDKLSSSTPPMTPICEQLPSAPYHCEDMINENPAMHAYCYQFYDPKNPQSEKFIYAPVSTVACVRRDATGKIVEYRYFPPDQVMDSCWDLHAQDKSWKTTTCYCCCSCLAYGTMIAVPTGFKPIQEINTGDLVLAGTLSQQEGVPKLNWEPTAATFSSGVAGGDNPAMVYIAFGEGEKTGDLVCSLDQVLMLANGRLITAEKLHLDDKLMDKDGNPVSLKTVAIGSFVGGVHHIATKSTQDLSLDGHLVLAGGVVAGDYYLQLYYDRLPADLKAPDVEVRTAVHSPEYASNNANRRTTAKLLFGAPLVGKSKIELQHGQFTVFTSVSGGLLGAPNAMGGPDAVSFLTQAQAQDILEKGDQLPLSNPVPKAAISNLFHLFQGFFPDYVFYLDWYQMEPNAYAFEQYGKKFVVVNGGLARMVGFGYEGLAMAIAHCIARFAGDGPKGDHALAGTGAADFYAFSMISRTIWFANYFLELAEPAYFQIKELFGLISAENAQGDLSDPVNETAIACRLKAMQAGLAGGGLPECAGGPPLPKIALQQVTGSANGLTLTLSLAPVPETATNVGNYVITPETPVLSATQDPQTNFVIHLVAKLESGTTYTVAVQNLLSLAGSGVDPDHATMECTVK